WLPTARSPPADMPPHSFAISSRGSRYRGTYAALLAITAIVRPGREPWTTSKYPRADSTERPIGSLPETTTPSPTVRGRRRRNGPWGRSAPGCHQGCHGEPVVADAGLLTLVEVPALLPGEAMARERRLRGVLELHVDHDDRRGELHLVGVLDGTATFERALAESVVVDPDLPELARLVVDVRERDRPGFLVDEDDALRVGVLRELGDAFDHVHLALLPDVVERPVDLVVPLHREVLAVHDADHVALAEVLPVHPRHLAGI